LSGRYSGNQVRLRTRASVAASSRDWTGFLRIASTPAASARSPPASMRSSRSRSSRVSSPRRSRESSSAP